MLTKQLKLAAVLTAAIGTGAMAQDATIIEGEDTSTVVVPSEALQADEPAGLIAESDYPVFSQDMNDEAIAETLIAQGFENIHIKREVTEMTVTASRDGEDIELVYNLAQGRLIGVNGEEILSDEDMRRDDSSEPDDADDATDDATDDASGDDGAADGAETGEGTGDDSPDGDTSGDDGSDDAGSDTDAGSDAGSDTGSDGGSAGEGADGGSDGGSDGGEGDSDNG